MYESVYTARSQNIRLRRMPIQIANDSRVGSKAVSRGQIVAISSHEAQHLDSIVTLKGYARDFIFGLLKIIAQLTEIAQRWQFCGVGFHSADPTSYLL